MLRVVTRGKSQVLVLLVRVKTTAMEWIPVMARTRTADNIGKESVVEPPTSVARRVLHALLRQSDTDMMTEYKRIAAIEAHLDATVDPTRRHLASGNRGIGQRIVREDPQIE